MEQTFLTYLAALAESASACTGPGCAQSRFAKRTASPAPFSAATGPTSHSTTTSEPSPPPGCALTRLPAPTSSAAASRARTSALPGGPPGWPARVRACGPIWRAWSPSADRVGWWLRTFLASEAGARTRCWPTWRRSVTPLGRSWWVLPMPARPIAGHGCGWWPRPYVPTPVARDWKTGSAAQRTRRRACQLNDAVGGRLHPDYAEWLMGFPPGWTAPGPASGRPASMPLATPPYPPAPP